MTRSSLVTVALLLAAGGAVSVEIASALEPPTGASQSSASSPGDGPEAREAFKVAKELGTEQAWNAFIEAFPSGFYADIARAYLLELQGDQTVRSRQVVARSGKFMGFDERFNRYYTDPSWTPQRTVFIDPEGGGDGTSRGSPLGFAEVVAVVAPGTRIVFLPGEYKGFVGLTDGNSGTYDDPVVFAAEPGVTMTCEGGIQNACFNIEGASYVAIDGFRMTGGDYGIRAVGVGYDAGQHVLGIALLNNHVSDQHKDPFFTGQASWTVLERNLAHGAGEGDGHGIYLSNGGDWNIVRFNETHSNVSSDFQVNPDPASTCVAEGIPANDPRCDAVAGEGEGGRGASDFFLIDSNYFHHSKGPGPNFTSLRLSLIRNNIFGPQARHNASFWQETDNPKLGTRDNTILHNLFVTTDRHAAQFIAHSGSNTVANNLFLGLDLSGDAPKANPGAVLVNTDDTVTSNSYRGNVYVSGSFEGFTPGDAETRLEDLDPAWFKRLPVSLEQEPGGYALTASAPFRDTVDRLDAAKADRTGQSRPEKTDPGPIESP